MSFPSHTDIFGNVATEAKYPLVNGQQIVPSGVGIGRGFNTSLTTTPTAGQGTSLRELRVRDLSDVDKYLEPTETPFWSSIKQGGEVRTARSEWAISHLTPNTTTVGSTGFNGTDNSVAVDLDEPGRVTPGSMIMVGSEQIWVHPDGVSSMAARFMREFNNIDVTDLLPQVRCPTLVLHSRDDRRVPYEEGRLIAGEIPGAEFVAVPGMGHDFTEALMPEFIRHAGGFLTAPSSAARRPDPWLRSRRTASRWNMTSPALRTACRCC